MAIISTSSKFTHALTTTNSKKVYRYFGYGSNVIPSTMKCLRQIEVREVTAAVLPDYELKFASAAFVRPVSVKDEDKGDANANESDGVDDSTDDRTVVHGLLYTLTEDEFAKVGQTEGVPFGYRWQSCRVYPYRGDGKQAGKDCMDQPDAQEQSIQAYTLVEPTPASSQQRQQQQRRKRNQQKRNKNKSNDSSIPPSASYLGLIREGARLWRFDRSYQDKLSTIEAAKSNNLLFPEGWEGPALQLAEKATGTKRTYMIDGY